MTPDEQAAVKALIASINASDRSEAEKERLVTLLDAATAAPVPAPVIRRGTTKAPAPAPKRAWHGTKADTWTAERRTNLGHTVIVSSRNPATPAPAPEPQAWLPDPDRTQTNRVSRVAVGGLTTTGKVRLTWPDVIERTHHTERKVK